MTTPKANNQAKILSASMEAEGKTLARMFDYSDIALDLTGTHGKSAQKIFSIRSLTGYEQRVDNVPDNQTEEERRRFVKDAKESRLIASLERLNDDEKESIRKAIDTVLPQIQAQKKKVADAFNAGYNVEHLLPHCLRDSYESAPDKVVKQYLTAK